MKFRFATIIAGWLTLIAPAMSPAAPADAPFTGTWSGSFEIHYVDGRIENGTAWAVLQQAGESVAGTAGPRAEQQEPIRDAVVAGNRLTFVVNTTSGKVLNVTLDRDGDRLTGEAIGEIGDDKVRGLLDMKLTENATITAAAPDPLYQKILALDTEMFEAFNTCTDPVKLQKHASFFVKELEFYHDNGGASWTRDEYMKGVRNNVCGKFHRELELASFRVWPIKDFGAISQGTHRFCHSATTCEGVGQFTMIWREKDGKWQVTRAMSYDHRSENVPAQGH